MLLLLSLSTACRRASRETADASSPTASKPAVTALPDVGGSAPTLELLTDQVTPPAFSVTTLDGRTLTRDDLKGKVVLVNFWATWCPPCRAEIPDLIALQAKYPDQLLVLGISEDEAPVDEVKAFVAAQKMTYPVAMVNDSLRQAFHGVSALPTTFVIDREGRIQQRHVGMLNAERTELETRWLAGLQKNVTVTRVEDAQKALLANAAQAKEIPGVDLTRLSTSQRTAALKALNEEHCTCGCELTLAACRINDPSCGVSLPLAKKVVARVAGTASTN